MSAENATVHVSNISPTTTEKEIRDFFSFCGKIKELSLTPTSGEADAPLSSTITFEQPSAARTALLLDNTQLSNVAIHVSAPASLSDLQQSAEHAAHEQDEELRQEDKPRAAVLAEYLSHGYIIGDKALQRGIELDEKHGLSNKFIAYLNNLNARFKVADKTRAADTSYGLTEKANHGYSTVARYLETALNTPTGQRVRAFYEKGSKQVLDIHAEARRLADLRAAEEANKKTEASASEKPPVGESSTAPVASSSEKTTYQ